MMLDGGATAPEIRLTAVTEESVILSEMLTQGPVALVFFKISCPTCQYTLPFLNRLYSSESPDSPRLVGVSQDKRDATVEFSNHFGVRFPVLLDPGSENYPVSNAYGITHVPSLFLVETDGRIAWSLNGFHKMELENLSRRFGKQLFETNERVPAIRPG